MASWSEVEAEAPEIAALARALFDAHTHNVLGTLRADGSPRLSGTELRFADGELWIGSMWRSQKALDLQRDPRFAVHSSSDDPPGWKGDARVSGRVEEISDPDRIREVNNPDGSGAAESHLFRADIKEVVVVRLGDPPDHLVIDAWHEGRGAVRHERR